jgi:hypothetical protein
VRPVLRTIQQITNVSHAELICPLDPPPFGPGAPGLPELPELP